MEALASATPGIDALGSVKGLSLEAARATEPCGDCFLSDFFFDFLDSWLPILDRVWSKRGDYFEPLIAETPRLVLLIEDIRLDRMLFLLSL